MQFSLRRPRAFRKRQPTINLTHRIDIAFAVFDDLGERAEAVIGKFGEKSTTYLTAPLERAPKTLSKNCFCCNWSCH